MCGANFARKLEESSRSRSERGRSEGETRFHSIPSVEEKEGESERERERAPHLEMGGETDCDLAIRESSSSPLATTHSKPSLSPSILTTFDYSACPILESGGDTESRVVLASLSCCSFVFLSDGQCTYFFIAAIRPPSPPSKEIHRIGTGPLTAVRSRSAATSFATDVGSCGAAAG